MNRLLNFIGATLALMLILSAPTLAQETTVNLGDIVNPWLQLMLGAATLVVPALATWAVAELRRRTGIALEVAHMQTFQQALTNGAGLLVTKATQMASTTTIDVKHPAVADAIRYVATSAPDAVKYFGVTDAAIAEKIIAKLGLINPPVATVVPSGAGVVGGPPA